MRDELSQTARLTSEHQWQCPPSPLWWSQLKEQSTHLRSPKTTFNSEDVDASTKYDVRSRHHLFYLLQHNVGVPVSGKTSDVPQILNLTRTHNDDALERQTHPNTGCGLPSPPLPATLGQSQANYQFGASFFPVKIQG